MKRLLTKILAILLVIGGAVAVLWPVPNWRMYDVTWKPLAMTDAESFCAGRLLGELGTNRQDPAKMAACIADSTLDNIEPHIARSVQQGCLGLESVTGFDRLQCEDIVEAQQIWWLMDGGYTMDWNTAHPRPNVAGVSIVNAPRGVRNEPEREYTGRLP